MNILIITHSLRYNYGGILQNYALQQILGRLGINATTLKIRRKIPFFCYFLEYMKYSIRLCMRKKSWKPLSTENLNVICRNTDLFIDKYIKMSPTMNLIDKIWVREQNFDAIVVGSDQVLHPASYKPIEDVYLSFIHNIRKIIYAGSFGFDEWQYSEQQTSRCREFLKHFAGVSARENKGVYFFENKLGVHADLVLDPTLLLKKEDYARFVGNRPEGAVLTKYILDKNDQKERIIQRIAKQLDLAVISASNENMDNNDLSPAMRQTNSVESWLTSFYHSDYIITDSFHGTCFAIIFQKRFITIANKERGLDRFMTLLSYLGLENRLVYDESHIADLAFAPIDYENISQKLTVLRKKSIEFIIKSIE